MAQQCVIAFWALEDLSLEPFLSLFVLCLINDRLRQADLHSIIHLKDLASVHISHVFDLLPMLQLSRIICLLCFQKAGERVSLDHLALKVNSRREIVLGV